MKFQSILVTLVVAGGGFFGWLAACGNSGVAVLAQEKSAQPKSAGTVLPFPPIPSASVAGPTVRESKMTWRKEPERLKPGAPNVLIVLIDDVGFGIPDTFGGDVHTPTLTKIRDSYDVNLFAHPSIVVDGP
jgi:hypothetical protein